MQRISVLSSLILIVFVTSSYGQRITTIQLDGVQYFVSRMNPYSPELNYYLAYQYCRSLGLQLVSFETREKADSITQYLSNAGYDKYDFWTSGNKLGTDMFLWMSTGLPFNATFNYMKKSETDDPMDIPSGSTSPQRTARESDSGAASGCVALKSPAFEWGTDDCMKIKDFICEQTRCYYYNYGSIPVSSAQGRPIYSTSTSTTTTSTVRPFTSSHQTEDNKFYMGINDFINKLRSTSATPADEIAKDDVHALTGILPHGSGNFESEQTTNGPYNIFHELQDDPAALVDTNYAHGHEHGRGHGHDHEDDYVSTIEPETVTIYERSFKSVH